MKDEQFAADKQVERGAPREFTLRPGLGRAGSSEMVLSTPLCPRGRAGSHLLPLELADAYLQGIQGGPGLGAVHSDGPQCAGLVGPAARATLAA